ncbi:hypothetical protein [Lysinibacillus sphaericus]|uniref:Uncharacterized protein n=1 Tax=Lysinibacillus sphaericus (strain C3-41) TaxID=444177 RepID=B1I0E5_LYSSC|nr:hypothetical protein [Lysinibacillus sphaericus]MBE5085686.1 hypothetical protein [Bacillus thuringiensis]ACA42304.1 hypothetical protein Bsph_p074 [Lysinibacillus sphaericus C3-41]AMO35447.1 hypothetical protein AR327_23435 [Lysinibacillus sphaericus]AMR93120.1 hypothetical protein A1T07_23220 [Lysinibacillus sphaericus]MBG9710698.1 hypothetical protein [Lysinibacillus sphaericus]
MRLVIFAILTFFLIMFVNSYSQDPKIIEGTIEKKFYQEKKCIQELTYDPALNMYLPKENCEGPRWTITINNKEFQVTETLYNKLEVDSFYSLSYHPFKGLSLLKK